MHLTICRFDENLDFHNSVQKISTAIRNFVLMNLHMTYFKKMFKNILFIDYLELYNLDTELFKNIKTNKLISLTKDQETFIKKLLITLLPSKEEEFAISPENDELFAKHWKKIIDVFPFEKVIINELSLNPDEDGDPAIDCFIETKTKNHRIYFNSIFVPKIQPKFLKQTTDTYTIDIDDDFTIVEYFVKNFPEQNHYTKFFKDLIKKSA